MRGALPRAGDPGHRLLRGGDEEVRSIIDLIQQYDAAADKDDVVLELLGNSGTFVKIVEE